MKIEQITNEDGSYRGLMIDGCSHTSGDFPMDAYWIMRDEKSRYTPAQITAALAEAMKEDFVSSAPKPTICPTCGQADLTP